MAVETYHLTIKLKKFTKRERREAKFGFIDKKGPNRYVMYVNTEFSLLETIGTLYHEFSHWLFFTVFKDNKMISVDQEHGFCEEMDDHAKEEFKKCLGANTKEDIESE